MDIQYCERLETKPKRLKNRVAIDAAFPCIPTIKKGRGRGGGHLSGEDTYLIYWPWGGCLLKEIQYTI